MKDQKFINFSWATLVVILLVVIAGSVVRMSGSGMGCPDWPKCFGYLIPPTEEAQVTFQPNTSYQKGQMIVVGDELQSAKTDFTTGSTYKKTNWETYEKHDYAIFNPLHTWVEYINRLFGALSGFFMLVLFAWSIIKAIKRNIPWWIPILAFIGVLLLGFQAWLGKVVVDTHLSAAKLTAHMFGAFALITIMLLIIRYSDQTIQQRLSKPTKWLVGLGTLFVLTQVFLGTEFRVIVDAVSGHQATYNQNFAEVFKSQEFLIHQIFAFVLSGVCILLLYRAQKEKEWNKGFTFLTIFLALEMAVGFLMKGLDFPFLSQPAHLLLSCLLFAALNWLLLLKTE